MVVVGHGVPADRGAVAIAAASEVVQSASFLGEK
jgi:hypothetical protein